MTLVDEPVCTCGHPAEYHTGPYTTCGAIGCLCLGYDPFDVAPRGDDDDNDDGPGMEFVVAH